MIVAQAGGEATASVLLGALLVCWVVFTIFGMSRRLAFVQIGILFATLYVGYLAGTWPGTGSDGLLLSLWTMFWDSLRIIWDLVWNAIGVDSLSSRLGFNR